MGSVAVRGHPESRFNPGVCIGNFQNSNLSLRLWTPLLWGWGRKEVPSGDPARHGWRRRTIDASLESGACTLPRNPSLTRSFGSAATGALGGGRFSGDGLLSAGFGKARTASFGTRAVVTLMTDGEFQSTHLKCHRTSCRVVSTGIRTGWVSRRLGSRMGHTPFCP